MIENALPCPFCGGVNLQFIKEGVDDEEDVNFAIICDCGVSTGGYTSKKDALKFWNDRAPVLLPSESVPATKNRAKRHGRDVTYD